MRDHALTSRREVSDVDDPEYVLAFFPTYLTDEDGNDAWDLHGGRAWDDGRAGVGGGPDSRDARRDDDPADLAAWVAGRLGYPVTLTAEAYRIGYPLAVVDGYRRGEPEAWRTEPLYRVRPVDRAQAAAVEQARGLAISTVARP